MRAHAAVLVAALAAAPAAAAEFRSVGESGAVLYDGPSLKSKKLYVATRHLPVEVISDSGGWVKVREPGGEMLFVERKALSDRRTIVVTAALADVREAATDQARLVFQAKQGVVLDLSELSGADWVRVRHADGAAGYVRLNQIWGY